MSQVAFLQASKCDRQRHNFTLVGIKRTKEGIAMHNQVAICEMQSGYVPPGDLNMYYEMQGSIGGRDWFRQGRGVKSDVAKNARSW